MRANAEQQVEMGLEVDSGLQQLWQQKIATGEAAKLDDLGDSMLHGLSEILCGSSNYRPLTPATPNLHVSRSIVISVFPDRTYWIVLNSTWNLFTIENIGVYESKLVANLPYKSPVNVESMVGGLDRRLSEALREPQQSNLYVGVEMVKVIVKQIGRDVTCDLSPPVAGALTNSTVEAMKKRSAWTRRPESTARSTSATPSRTVGRIPASPSLAASINSCEARVNTPTRSCHV